MSLESFDWPIQGGHLYSELISDREERELSLRILKTSTRIYFNTFLQKKMVKIEIKTSLGRALRNSVVRQESTKSMASLRSLANNAISHC